jgi:pimeloyl-ACP methyl ester carboxylesterase
LGFPPNFYEPLLNADYQIIRIDNRGTGESDWMKYWTSKTAFSLEEMATDVIAVMDKLQIEKVHIIGYSMGGMIGQRLAINYPNRILSLTSIMTTGFYNDPKLTGLPVRFALKFGLTFLVYAFRRKTINNSAKLHLAVNRVLKGKGYNFDDKIVLQKALYEITERRGYNVKVERPHSKAIQLSGSRYEELKKIQVPTLVIHGTADPLVLLEHAEKYAPMIPKVKTFFIENLGHHFPKCHSEEIANAILSHLTH